MSPRRAIGGTFGPFRVVGVLGTGGMGVVHHAVDVRTGTPVALKTVRVPRTGQLLGIRREIRALARLRHPGIVRILDEGVEEGVPWYAMELVEGMTLRSVASTRNGTEPTMELHRADTLPAISSGPVTPPTASGAELDGGAMAERTVGPRLPPTLVARIVRRLCEPLGYLHGEGIVHRDLKPENVLLRPDGSVVIVDFGALARFSPLGDREALDRIGEISGTVFYMSPEQVRGDLTDARSDLYSLGCVMYELLTGEPPFVGAPAAVLAAHLGHEAVAPSRRIAGVPHELNELTLALLAKRPAERPGQAAAIAHALAALDPDEGEGALPAPPARTSLTLYRSELRGRDAILGALEEQLAEALRGRGRMVVLRGGPGSGKTRVAMHVGQRAARGDVAVHPCRCRRTSQASEALLPQVLQPIVDAAREGGAAEAVRLLGAGAPVLASLDPSIRSLPGLGGVPDGGPAGAPPERQRLLDALRESWRAFVAGGRHLWIVDDAHLADAVAVELLLHLARSRAFEDRAAMVLVTARPGESAAISRLESRAAAVLDLPPLTSGDVAAIVSDMLGLPRPWPLLEAALGQRAGGNPSIAAEYLRGGVDAGLLVPDGRGGWSAALPVGEEALGAALPATLPELLAARAAALPEREREAAVACAIHFGPFDAAAVAAVAGVSEMEALDALDALERRGVIEPAEADRFRVTRPEMAAILEATLGEEERRAAHRAAAAYLEATAGVEVRTGEIGRHLAAAGDADRARPLLRRAVRLAGNQHAHKVALELFPAYLAIVDPASEEAIAERVFFAEWVLVHEGSLAVAEAELEAALVDARALGAPGLLGHALRALSYNHHQRGRVPEALALLREAVEIARRTSDPGLAPILINLGNLLRETGEVGEAEACYREAGSLLEDGRDRGSSARLALSLGALEHERGEVEEAGRQLEIAREAYRDTGNVRSEALATMNLATMHLYAEDFDAAERLIGIALESFRAIGDDVTEAFAFYNRALVSSGRGDRAGAVRHCEEAVRLARRAGSPRYVGAYLSMLASCMLERGAGPGEVQPLCEEAIGILRQLGDRRLLSAALNTGAAASLGAGDAAAARALLEESVGITREIGDRGSEVDALVAASRVARLQGDLVAARAYAEDALGGGENTPLARVTATVALARVELAEGGGSARSLLERARSEAARSRNHEAGELCAELERDVIAGERGSALFRGDDPREMPAALREALGG